MREGKSGCGYCNRPAYLWGGYTCDACDADGNGIEDQEEVVSMGESFHVPTLFPVEEKGWKIVGRPLNAGAVKRESARIHRQLVKAKRERRLIANEALRGRRLVNALLLETRIPSET